jgi:putative serine protease PepD
MAMRSPRHLWTGEWRLESDQAREAAEEEAARRRAARAAAEREREAAAARTGAPQRSLGLKAAGAIALAAGAVAAGAFAAGALLNNDDPAAPQPLPAVSGKPVQPDKGQTQAGKIYAQASPAVVSVRTPSGSGTGFLVDNDGTLVTNAHVVGNSDRVVVKFGQDGRSIDGQVSGSDASSDLAVVHIDPSSAPRNAKPLQFADSRQVRVGDKAIAIGNPFGLDRTATEGIVSGIGREIKAPNGFSIDEVIQTDAPINPGNSGGPLLDARGHVIGINAQIKSQSGGGEGVGFAIPVDAVRRSLRELREKGRVDYGYLGVESLTIWPQLADRLGLDVDTGALVQRVVEDSPAEDAGIEAGDEQITFQGQDDIAIGGDLIVGVNGEEFTREHDLADEISDHSAGDRVRLTLLRDGERRTVQVELGRRPARSSP